MLRRVFLQFLAAGSCQPAFRAFGQSTRAEIDLQKLVTPETRKAVEQGLLYLQDRQHPDGAFGSGNSYKKNVGVTGLCGLAMLAAGHTPGDGKLGESVDLAIDYLLSQADGNGFINEPGVQIHGPMYGHGFAVLFLAEVYGMTKRGDLRSVLDRAVKLIIASQNKEGGWRYDPKPVDADISVTVCQVMALRAARNAGFFVSKKTIDDAVEYIRKSQNSDGGFRYQMGRQPESAFARSAAAIVGLQSAGIYEGPEIERGINYIKRFQPSPKGLQPYQIDHYYYGHYYAVQAMWHVGGEDWAAWYEAIRDQVLSAQHKLTGGWQDRTICPEYSSAMACLILETPYGFLPIFQK
ncbi:MAG TPA: prenyltransferase/squalene oxidase repeat-containing protein [Planctomycetaceae bacterium]|nr:prenyltransferase/squalene oxidase repeat-containing protein [Planctomycetaceae bacterium]